MIGKIIQKMRKSAGYSQKELAQKLNIAQTTISGYETDSSTPNFDVVYEIAEICDFAIMFIDKNSSEIIDVEMQTK